ncbi:SPFH domain-containing protein [Bacteroidia bacterium]|nr:SPFH domain-containing protein [Bacteroidia bacterium]|tara:strand:+ start:4758 stop:5831 length:1074 start_codon:yes stop_codon:yes gene_type:complete
MAIIDVLKYDGPNDVLIWKWRSESNSSREQELRMGSQLIVNQSQEACFYKGGELLDVFGPGTHTLSTKNLPVLSGFVGLAYGGDSPFSAEVYFINKAVSMDAKFGLVPFNMVEPTFKVPIPISCRGSFALVVENAKLFLTKMVGTVKDFDTNTLSELFRGVISENVKNSITKISKDQNLSPLELESIVHEVGGAVKAVINSHLQEFGLALKLFNIESIPVIDEDQRVKDVVAQFQKIMAEDLDERMRLKRHADNLETYKVERSFDTTEKAAENIGGGEGGGTGGIIGTMIGLGMVNPIAQQMGAMMSKNTTGAKIASGSSDGNTIELLKQLGELKDAGILTEVEFSEKKKELLNKLK